MEILLSLAEAVFSILVADVAARPHLSDLRQRLRGDSQQKLGLQRALKKVSQSFARQYPTLNQSLFDAHFFEKPAIVQQFANLLIPGASVDRAVILAAWQAQFSQSFSTSEIQAMNEAFAWLIEQLTQAFKAEPALLELVNAVAIDNLHEIKANTSEQVEQQQKTNQLLEQMNRLLADWIAERVRQTGAAVQIGDGRGVIVGDNGQITIINLAPTPSISPAVLPDQPPALHPSVPPNPHPMPILPAIHLPFTNQKTILEEIFNPRFRLAYYLIDGPAGYGKTELLTHLHERFKTPPQEGSGKPYCSVLVSVESCRTQDDLIGVLCSEENFDLNKEQVLSDPDCIPESFANALHEKYLSCDNKGPNDSDPEPKINGFALLFDNLGERSKEISMTLLTDFLPRMEDELRGYTFFSKGRLNNPPLVVIIAGRYLQQFYENLPKHFPHHPLPFTGKTLQPFVYEVVYDTAHSFLAAHTQEDMKQLAAHAIHFTGGHPGCIADVLELYRRRPLRPDNFIVLRGAVISRDYVAPRINEIFDSLPTNLQSICSYLCLYRGFNYDILEKLQNTSPPIPGLAPETDLHRLIDCLQDTFLYTRKDRFHRDAITRRLLVLRTRHTLTEAEFRARCQQAYEIYLSFFKLGLQDPALWVIECLYQFLQMHVAEIGSPAGRAGLKGLLYKQALPTVLGAFTNLFPARNLRDEIEILLEKIEKDEEFKFTVNYYLREVDFCPTPCEELTMEIQRQAGLRA